METPTDQLPKSLTRPLIWSVCALGLFLGAAGIWAGYAPLTTTIRVQGTLVSSKPSYDLQHPYGGRIVGVFARLHDPVAEGALLFELDVSTQRAALAQTQAQIAILLHENAVILAQLDRGDLPDATDDDRALIVQQYTAAQKTLLSKIAARQEDSESARVKLDAIDRRLQVLTDRRALLEARYEKRVTLVDRGIVTQQDIDITQDAMLSLDAEMEEQMVQRIGMYSDLIQADAAIETLREEHVARLLTTFNANAKRLPELRKQVARLRDEIDSAAVHAPISGTITQMTYDTNQMYAGRGQTLATLAEALDAPEVRVSIPTTSIDQVTVGMTGKLTIDALPQRAMPNIIATLTDIAPEATRNSEGVPIHYTGTARLRQADLEAARASMGESFRLATDMPVSVALEGRKTTMAAYLFGGFAKLFTDALQD